MFIKEETLCCNNVESENLANELRSFIDWRYYIWEAILSVLLDITSKVWFDEELHSKEFLDPVTFLCIVKYKQNLNYLVKDDH